MACENVVLPGGGFAIVCGLPKRKKCACGARATIACDWKSPERKSGTCDVPLCEHCTTSPAEGKDLCPEHVEAFEAWKRARRKGRLDL